MATDPLTGALYSTLRSDRPLGATRPSPSAATGGKMNSVATGKITY